MTEPPLSRSAGVDPKPRPTDMLIVPGIDLASAIARHLMTEGEIFTVEPSPTQPGVWHLGVFESGKQVALSFLQALGLH